jgi:hypothetical protein
MCAGGCPLEMSVIQHRSVDNPRRSPAASVSPGGNALELSQRRFRPEPWLVVVDLAGIAWRLEQGSHGFEGQSAVLAVRRWRCTRLPKPPIG